VTPAEALRITHAWLVSQIPRIEKATHARVTIVQRHDGIEVVARWPETRSAPAGQWERFFSVDEVGGGWPYNRCQKRRELTSAILRQRMKELRQ
jgi:hypothetical protein